MAKPELLSGTLDLLVLQVLNGGPLHGFAIAERIHALSKNVLIVEEGFAVPFTGHRMEEKGWIEPRIGVSPDEGRRAKFYNLTKEGEEQRTAERQTWDRIALAIGDVLKNA